MPAFTSRRVLLISLSATVAIVWAAITPLGGAIARAFAAADVHAPNFGLLLSQSLAVQLHVYAALAALAIGTFVLLRPKGTASHKLVGWAWVIAMAITAISSLFIMEINDGMFSFIHLFSGWTLVALPMGIYAIRRRHLRGHRGVMVGTFFGGLIVAGAFTFIPGRLMWAIFFG